MIFDFTIGVSSFITLGVLLFAFIGQWALLRAKSESNTRKANEAFETAIEAKNELASLRLEISKEYATTNSLHAVESRLANAVSELTSEIRDLRKYLLENK